MMNEIGQSKFFSENIENINIKYIRGAYCVLRTIIRNPLPIHHFKKNVYYLKFIYSEKATNFCKITTVDLTVTTLGQIYGGDFAKFCGLLRIYEL